MTTTSISRGRRASPRRGIPSSCRPATRRSPAREPGTLHDLIWNEIDEEAPPFEPPADEPLLLASYRVGDDFAGPPPTAFLESMRAGGAIPDMPAWLDTDTHVSVPLERAYQAAWEACPADYRFLVEHGRLPDEEPAEG